MKSLRTISLCAVASAFLSSSILFAQRVAPAVRITAPVDPSQLVTLKGTVHPLANAQNDRGPASPSMALDRLHLVFKRSPAQETALRQLIQEQNTPGSASYHQWLTPAQFAAQFGPSQQDIQTVETWLSDQGFTVNKVEPGSQALEISGTVDLLQSAFHTQIHKYAVNGQIHYANANDPQIPAALAPVVGGFASLNNFRYHNYAQKLGKATYDPSTGQATPSWTIGSGSFGYQGYNFVLSPADYAVQYDIPSTLKGDGQTIAIVNESNINIDLVNQFRTLFGLPANPPQVIIDGNDPGVDGINNPDGPNYASVEAYLDVEWSGAVAPDATIDLVIAGDTSLESGLALAAEHAVYSNVAPVISVSFGGCELQQGSSNLFWNALWEQAAVQGQTVVVSSGDSGSAGCDASGAEYATGGQAVSGIASTPYDVAVGGTDFFYSSWNQGANAIDSQLGTYWNTTASNNTPSASIKGYIPEQPWNDSQYGLNLLNTGSTSTVVVGGGGGASNAAVCPGNAYGSNGSCTVKASGYPKPAWQTGVSGIPSDNVRDLPDVSLFAANGYNDSYYPICATDGDCQPVGAGSLVQIFGVGGTSASTPSFAGIMALVNQKYGRQGQADTILYPLKAQFPAAFHDVTNGNISMPCAFSASANLDSPNCIQIAGVSYLTVNSQLEGQIGSGTTVEYNAGAGYNLATGLGTIDAANLINDWGQVKLASSGVTLNATPTSFTHGQSVTVNGAVTGSGTPTGAVAIETDSTALSQQGQTTFALDSSGKYSGSISTLPGGQYNIWASYGGDAKNAASVSGKTLINVAPENSGIAFGLFEDANIYSGSGTYLISSPSSSVDYGTQLVLSARVAPSADVPTIQACTPQGSTTKCPTYSAPTGTVAFKDSSSTLNNAVINTEGDAEYNAPFSVGQHSVSASYSGDNSYNASTSSPITFTVAKDTPKILMYTEVIDQNNDWINGPNQPTVVTVLVENAAQSNASTSSANFPVPVQPPTGSVTLSPSPSIANISGSGQLSPLVDPFSGAVSGVATFVIPATNGTINNTYSITANYAGDSNYTNASATQAESILNTSGGGINSSITATLSGSLSPNSTVTISGTVTGTSAGGAPTGDVVLYAGGLTPGYYISIVSLKAGSGTSTNYSITLNSQSVFQGTNELTVEYIPIGQSNPYLPSAYVLTNNLSNPLSDFSIIPQSTIVPVTSSTGGTVTLNLASINGFSGGVNLACSAPAGITCNLPSTVSLASGSASAALKVTASAAVADGSYPIAVTGKDATGEYVHVVNVNADVTGSSAGFTLANGGNITVGQGATTSNTSPITVTPTNNFNANVYLSCALTTAPAGSASPAACVVTPASVNIASASPGTATLTIDTNAATTTGNYTVTVKGTAGDVTATTEVTVTVNATVNPTFTLAASTPASVSPGGSTSSTITASTTTGYQGSISFTCALTQQPSGAQDLPSCTIPGTIHLTSTASSGTTTASVATTPATSGMNDVKPIFWPTAGSGTVLACLLFFWIPKKRRSWLALVVLLVFVLSIGGMACGGGGNGGGGGNPGTTAGSYTFTVTATGNPAASPEPTQTFTVTVQ